MENSTAKYLICAIYLLGIIACTNVDSTGKTAALKDTAAQRDTFWDGQQQTIILDFEETSLNSEIITNDATTTQLVEEGATSGRQAIKINLQGDEKEPGIMFKPSRPIDTRNFKNFCLVFDATNLTDEYSVHFHVSVANPQGGNIRRASVIPAGKTKTYFMELAGPYVNRETGLRDDPKPWNTNSEMLKVGSSKNKADFSEIASIAFFVQWPVIDKTIILDNIRLVESPAISEDYLVGIIDKYGQAAKKDFTDKITSDEQLKAMADAELKQLADEGTMAGRSKFGGWSEGPKLEATGFFRTEKVDGKWAMVDPEGYLFFSNGIANVRMANTTTFTGIDFKNEKVRYRDPEDVTPEDSRGMVTLKDEVTNTAYVAYPERHRMFLELPAYNSPLANNYSYRREQHKGMFEHGETFSHYQANLERRYGETTPGAHLTQWKETTLQRFLNWGFTSFGNWAGYEFYHEDRMPYFANGWIIGDFKTVLSGSDYWGPMPDAFDPEFKRRAAVTVKVIAEEVKGNPWCIGVFIDNEKSWGAPGSTKKQYGIVLDGLSKKAADSPLKKAFMNLLQQKYTAIESLNDAWETQIRDWKTLEEGINYKDKKTYNEAMVADFSILLEAYADQYFRIVDEALAAVLPNHMYLGCRFTSWGMGKEVRSAAKKYVDIFSYNYYKEAIGEKYWKFLEDIDRPSIIGEFHMGSVASGMFHPGLVHAADQEDRARMYKKYMEMIIDNPYFVGAHWFQYIDSPVSGRAHDGENYNIGFVTNTDVPYAPLVQAAKEVNAELYERRFGK